MPEQSIVLWENPELIVIPKQTPVQQMVSLAAQLSTKDKNQILKTFQEGSYEMVATYIWTKTMNALRTQLGKLGISFIAELLDRSDINEFSNLQQVISEFDAIRLAEDLGFLSGTAAFRLKRTLETVAHFSQTDLDDDPENELSEEETKVIIRSCIQGVLGHNRIGASLDFKNFRRELEEATLTAESPSVVNLLQSAYFFQRTTLRILLSLIKSTSGAQLENAIANANLIIPAIWNKLSMPERFQVGRIYSELFSDGKSKAASGLRQVLLKVNGFDFVPEDLRSSSFVKIANQILNAHFAAQNFYNEPVPMNLLYKMGSVIPSPAFPVCMTATLCVKLGNYYGVSNAAQPNATALLIGRRGIGGYIISRIASHLTNESCTSWYRTGLRNDG